MNSNQKPTVPSTLVNHILPLMDQYGIDIEAFLTNIGFEGQHIQQEQITLEQLFRALKKGQELVDIPFIGLVIGSNYNAATYGMAGMAAITQQTVGDCLKASARFGEMMMPAIAITWVEYEDMVGIRLEENFALNEFSATVTEVIFSSFYENLCTLTNKKGNLHSLKFNYEAPQYASIYRQYFKCDVEFYASHTEFLIPRELASFPLDLADIDTAKLIEKQFYCLTPSITSALLLSRIKNLVKSKMASIPNINIGHIGKELGMSGRTLRRRLAEIGTCSSEIIEQIKKEQAMLQLKRSDKKITDISYSLEFPDLSSFCKTFKKWTGVAPSTFRTSFRNRKTDSIEITQVDQYLKNKPDLTKHAYSLIMQHD